jgi:hypothetical protein
MLEPLLHEQIGPFFRHWYERLIRLQFEMIWDSFDQPQIQQMIAEGCPNAPPFTGDSDR